MPQVLGQPFARGLVPLIVDCFWAVLWLACAAVLSKELNDYNRVGCSGISDCSVQLSIEEPTVWRHSQGAGVAISLCVAPLTVAVNKLSTTCLPACLPAWLQLSSGVDEDWASDIMVWGDATFSEYKTRMSVAVAFAWLAWSVGVAQVGCRRQHHICCGKLICPL